MRKAVLAVATTFIGAAVVLIFAGPAHSAAASCRDNRKVSYLIAEC